MNTLSRTASDLARETPAKAWLRAMETVARLQRSGRTLGHILDDLAERHGPRIAVSAEAGALSYADFAQRARRYARWANRLGVEGEDAVGLLAPNSPDYLACWIGVSRSGAVVSLLNTQAPPLSLAHGLRASGVLHLIFDPRYEDTVRQACALLEVPPRLWPMGEAFDAELAQGGEGEFAGAEGVTMSTTALHIFTSGTTGMPKAARISHGRILSWAGWFMGLADMQSDDIMYDCLPLFHSVGGVVAPISVLLAGGRVVLREGFSARRFWDDVRTEGCTLAQYIGELCHYLLAAPPHPDDARHGLRMMIGNGLRPDVWEGFEARFAPPRILEFYAATEGTFSLFNLEGRVGSLGRFPAFLARRPPAILVRVDPDTLEISRNAQGLAELCAVGEVGEAMGRIAPGHVFEG